MPIPRLGIALLWLTLVGGCGTGAARNPEGLPYVDNLDVDSIAPGQIVLPRDVLSVKFAVIGDSGRGTDLQREVGAQMAAFRERFPFAFVVMLGDNIYEGPASPDDYRKKFEEPYRPLLDADVPFYAVLGNHDDPRQRFYPPFRMNGNRYYTFTPPVGALTKFDVRARFFALDSTNLDADQLRWLGEELRKSDADWKICLMHHPVYSSGRYRQRAWFIRRAVEPLFVANGVDIVFSGHEHIYERMWPQRGIQYFISGGASTLRRGDAREAPYVARANDEVTHFMLVEITRNAMHFQAISATGRTIDAGVLRRTRRPI